jgi:hypothetical protein
MHQMQRVMNQNPKGLQLPQRLVVGAARVGSGKHRWLADRGRVGRRIPRLVSVIYLRDLLYTRDIFPLYNLEL